MAGTKPEQYDDESAVICELCARVCEVDADTAEITGWIQTWDGWLCPKCKRPND